MKNQPMPRAHDWTILKLLKWTTTYFKSRQIDSPRMTAEILLAHCLKTQRIDLYLDHDRPLSKSELSEFKALIKRRASREPVAHMVGSKEFWSMDFQVSGDTLIPRPDTECLVEAALSLFASNDSTRRVLELGTGTGAVITALASERPHHLFFASDRSRPAVRLALENARQNDLADRIHFFCSDWLSALNPRKNAFDIILSNPPYIPTADIAALEPEIRNYEPMLALDGGPDGLSAIRHLVQSAHLQLNKNGWLLLEIGHDQSSRVKQIIDHTGHYKGVEFVRDYANHLRVIQAKKKL